MTKDAVLARQLKQWFESLGNKFMLQRCKQYFPDLEVQTVQKPEVAQITLNVLGIVQLLQNGKTINYRGRKRLGFLILLLEARVTGDSEISTNQLIAVLYPDLPEVDGKAALKQLVFQIRNSLGAQIIQSTPRGYALGEVASDAEHYLTSKDTTFWRDVYLLDLPDFAQSKLSETLIRALKNQLEILIETDLNETARLGQIYLQIEPYDRDALELTLRSLKSSSLISQKLYAAAQERFLELGEILPKSLEAFLDSTVLV